MTTPGGVPNLPAGALTLETLGDKLQDMTSGAMRSRAAARVPNIFSASNGGSPLSDLSPFGILTHLFAGFSAAVANADPSDITGPEDLPDLLLSFIEDLPVIGELVGLLEAIVGTYDGDDSVLLGIQEIFAPIRQLLHMIGSIHVGFPTPAQVELGFRRLQNIFSPVHVSRITDTPPNLLDDPDFELAESIAPVDGWIRDATHSANGVGASAKVVCDGSLKRLFHRTIIDDVTVGHTYNFAAKIETASFTTTDVTEITLSVVEYHGDAMGEIVDVAVRTTGSATWATMAGNYTVPTGVTAIGVCFGAVGATGSLWFSALNLHETDKMPRSYVDGLEAVRENLESLFSHVDLTIGPEDFEPGVARLTAAIDGAGATVRELLDGLRNKFTSSTASESDVTVAQVLIGADNVRSRAQSAQDSAITLANTADRPKHVPFWVSPNPFEDVSFPRALLMPDAVGDPPLVTIAAGTVACMAVSTEQNRVYNTVGFITDGDTPPATVYCKLQLVDLDTGDINTEYDLGNVSGDITTGTVGDLVDTRITLPEDIVAEAGYVWMLSILPITTGLVVAAIPRLDLPYTGVYPSYSTGLLAGQSSIPDTITDASLSSSASRVWACLGQAAQEDSSPVTIIDTFDVADVNNYMPASFNNFRTTSPSNAAIAIDGQQARCQPGGSPADASYFATKLCKTTVHSNDHAAQLTIGSIPWDSAAYGHVTDRAYVRCRNNGTAGVVMHVDGTSSSAVRVRIATVTNMISIGTVQATVTGLTGNEGDVFRIEATHDVGTGHGIYTCYRNDVAIPGATWTDTGDIIPVTKNFRSVGYGAGAYKHNAGFDVETPAGINEFTAYDLVA